MKWSGVDWIGVVQYRYKLRTLLNAVMNFRVFKILGNYRLASQILVPRVVLSSIELVL
jgi:hypothetical protein